MKIESKKWTVLAINIDKKKCEEDKSGEWKPRNTVCYEIKGSCAHKKASDAIWRKIAKLKLVSKKWEKNWEE